MQTKTRKTMMMITEKKSVQHKSYEMIKKTIDAILFMVGWGSSAADSRDWNAPLQEGPILCLCKSFEMTA